MESSPVLAEVGKNTQVYKHLNINPLTVSPQTSVHRFHDLLTRCLASGNAETHYARRIQDYFHTNNTINIHRHNSQKDITHTKSMNINKPHLGFKFSIFYY